MLSSAWGVPESAAITLRKLLARSELSLGKVATAAGYAGPSSIQRYFDPDTYEAERISVELAEKLVRAFVGRGQPPITEAEIMSLAGVQISPGFAEIAPPPLGAMPIDVPVYGTAAAGSGGDFSLNGTTIDYVRRPPGIANNRGVFCFYVRGLSMYPRYEEGDLAYVDPYRPAKSGDDVLVEMRPGKGDEPGTALVKQLVTKTPIRVILRQFNPPDDKIEIALSKILRVSPILRLTDLLGL